MSERDHASGGVLPARVWGAARQNTAREGTGCCHFYVMRTMVSGQVCLRGHSWVSRFIPCCVERVRFVLA